MVSPEELESKIRSTISGVEHLQIRDESGGCGAKYVVIIVSDTFQGKTTLQRHRLVNELLKDEIAQMHAFSQKTYTTKQYQDLLAK